MLTHEAFNAFENSKTSGACYFHFSDDRIRKVPATISSRTQRFYFRKLALNEIMSKLNIIVKSENFKIFDDALELIVSFPMEVCATLNPCSARYFSLTKMWELKDVEQIAGKNRI